MPRGVRNPMPGVGTLEPQSAAEQVQALSPRAAEARRERRRREDGDLDRMARMKLAIPRDVRERLAAEGKVARWVLDEAGRQADMHDNDWDVVEGVRQVAAGQSEDQKLVLMAKFADWHESDQLRDEADIADRERAITAGTSTENRRAGDGLVVPANQSNRITRERGL